MICPKRTLIPSLGLGLAVLMLLMLATGCSFARPSPKRSTYLLQPPEPAAPVTGATPYPGTIKVINPSITSAFEGRSFVIRLGENQFEQDYYNQFLVPPRLMLSQGLYGWLRKSRPFETALPSSSTLDSPWQVDLQVSDLYGDFRPGRAPSATFGGTFYLFRLGPGVREVHLVVPFKFDVPTKAAKGEALVEGWNQAIGQAFDLLDHKLREANLPQH